MTTYRTILTAETDAYSAIKTQLILALEKNPRSILEGDATASDFLAAAVDANTIPGDALTNYTITSGLLANDTIDQEALESDIGSGGAVGQSQIKLGSAFYTTTTMWNVSTGNGTAVAIPNGVYMLGWRSYLSAGTNGYVFKIGYYPYRNNEMGAGFDVWTCWVWHGVHTIGSNTSTLYIYWVQASPPYRLPGDGPGASPQDVRRFVFLDLDGDGNIISSAWTTDPPWYNPRDFPGLTHCADGRVTWQKPALPCRWDEALADPRRIAAYLDALRNGERTETELRIEDKSRPEAMDRRPHPFGNPAGSVVLLDPGHPVTDELIDLVDAGAPVGEALSAIRVHGAAPRGLRAPQGAPLMRAQWR